MREQLNIRNELTSSIFVPGYMVTILLVRRSIHLFIANGQMKAHCLCAMMQIMRTENSKRSLCIFVFFACHSFRSYSCFGLGLSDFQTRECLETNAMNKILLHSTNKTSTSTDRKYKVPQLPFSHIYAISMRGELLFRFT